MPSSRKKPKPPNPPLKQERLNTVAAFLGGLRFSGRRSLRARKRETMAAWLKDVKSGLRLALIIVGTIVILGLLGRGLRLISVGGWGDLALGIGIVFAVSVFLLATVRWWAKWFFAACCLFTLRTILAGVLGRTISVPSIVAPRILFAEYACIFLAMALLSYRFVSAKPNWPDSVCLVGAVVALVYSLFSDEVAVQRMLVAVLLLGFGSAYHNFFSRLRRQSAGISKTR